MGPLSNLTASGKALVTTLGDGVTSAGSGALFGPLRDLLDGSTGALGGLQHVGAGVTSGTSGAGSIQIDLSGMTIHAATAADGESIADMIAAKVREAMAQGQRRHAATRRGALHDGDSSGLGTL